MNAMLQRLLRLLAVVAVSLALPIQGLAAVTSGQCMSLGHHEAGMAVPAHDHGEHAAAEDAHESHSHADSGAKNGDGKSSHCGPCTACCASASIAGPATALNLPAPSSAAYGFSQFLPPSVQLEGLDRPPLAL